MSEKISIFGSGGFVKLYGSLAQSSLLETSLPTRWTFVFILSQADAKGRYRCATMAGLARAANITLEQAEIAIRELEAPDPESTSKKEAGRRIVRIAGGWQVINYEQYRDYRTERQVLEAERKRRCRKNGQKKDRDGNPSKSSKLDAGHVRDVQDMSRKSRDAALDTDTDTDTEAEAERSCTVLPAQTKSAPAYSEREILNLEAKTRKLAAECVNDFETLIPGI